MSVQASAAIGSSWRRSALSGVDPARCLDGDDTIVEVNTGSRLLAAAGPVLDRVADALAGTDFAVLLADSSAHVVDIRAGEASVRDHVDRSGVVTGRWLAEEAAGTNAVGTALEVGGGVSVRGTEHFAEALRGFSCYRHPIRHPVTRRTVGVLDISCGLEAENRLLPPFLVSVVRGIEDRLLRSASAPQRELIDAFDRAVALFRGSAVAAIDSEIDLENVHAGRLLDPADRVTLSVLIREAPLAGTSEHDLTLVSGRAVRAAVTRYGDGGLIVLTPTPEPRSAPEVAAPVSAAPPGGLTVVSGEAGTGRTTAAATTLDGFEAAWMDGADTVVCDHREWLRDVAATIDRAAVVENVHLLPAPVAHGLADLLTARPLPAPVVLTCLPEADLTGEHTRLIALADHHVDLPPLRHRRGDIPALVAARLTRNRPDDTVRLTPDAIAALTEYGWPGNVAELVRVVDALTSRRSAGDITAADLPAHIRSGAIRSSLTPLEQAERTAIAEALRVTDGNKSAAAARLGVSRTTLYRAIRRYRLNTS
ncbi:sigma-54-dependent Fis family transcriptional regulator [Gordonia shandongensis]|uniref:sigma-54-dependent Fis family transcriptional regulator n=1 Tax=Gordonia shandongensis TaxID=376351 RepID=UPI00041A81C2|nr:helix-turn-helix domain-containing protein [Gordonia shandongensis]